MMRPSQVHLHPPDNVSWSRLLLVGLLLLFKLMITQAQDTVNSSSNSESSFLNNLAITGWYGGGNCSSDPDNRCDGLSFNPLEEPLHLQLDTCYVNPYSTASVTFYKGVAQGVVVEFHVIFTVPQYSQLPTACDDQGACACTDADGSPLQLLQEVGEDCNSLYSFTYACTSRILPASEKGDDCVAPSSAVVIQNDETTSIEECSLLARVEVIQHDIFDRSEPTTAPVAPTTMISPTLPPSSEQEQAPTASSSISATTTSPTIRAESQGGGNNLDLTVSPNTASIDTSVTDTSPVPSLLQQNEATTPPAAAPIPASPSSSSFGFRISAGVMVGIVMVGLGFTGLLLFALQPKGGYQCCTKCCAKQNQQPAVVFLEESGHVGGGLSEMDEAAIVPKAPMQRKLSYNMESITDNTSSSSTMMDQSPNLNGSSTSFFGGFSEHSPSDLILPSPTAPEEHGSNLYNPDLLRLLSERSNRSASQSMFSTATDQSSSSGNNKSAPAQSLAFTAAGHNNHHQDDTPLLQHEHEQEQHQPPPTGGFLTMGSRQGSSRSTRRNGTGHRSSRSTSDYSFSSGGGSNHNNNNNNSHNTSLRLLVSSSGHSSRSSFSGPSTTAAAAEKPSSFRQPKCRPS